MKKITGTKLIIAGVALMFLLPSFLVVFAALLFEDLPVGAGLAIFYFPFSFSIIMIMFGVSLRRVENNDGHNECKKNVLKLLTPAQVAFSIALLSFSCMMIFVENEEAPVFKVFLASFLISFYAAAILVIVKFVKNVVKDNKERKKRAERQKANKSRQSPSPVRPMSSTQEQHCDFCGTTLGIEATYIIVDGKRLCPPCSAKVERLKKEEAEKKEAPKSPCSVCGTALPERDMYLVNSEFYCEECFNKNFGE